MLDRLKFFACIGALAATGCSAVSYAPVRRAGGPGELLISQQSLDEPYESRGVVQLTRKGVVLFGFAEIPSTDLEAALEEVAPEIRKRGGDALVNVRVQHTQYTTGERILGALFFLFPFPAEVTINGEVVKRVGVAGGGT